MNRDLEAVLKAYDAFQLARPPELQRLGAIYQSMLDDVLQRNKGLSRARAYD
jgi:hypothetical protein